MKSEIYCKALFAAVIALFAWSFDMSAQQKKDEGPDLYEQAEAEADRMQHLLDLEDWQTFYVDSILKHDLTAMMGEIDELGKSKVSNIDIFQDVRDRWWDQIDASYKKIFTEEQWKEYLKTGAAKAQKQREKRRSKK